MWIALYTLLTFALRVQYHIIGYCQRYIYSQRMWIWTAVAASLSSRVAKTGPLNPNPVLSYCPCVNVAAALPTLPVTYPLAFLLHLVFCFLLICFLLKTWGSARGESTNPGVSLFDDSSLYDHGIEIRVQLDLGTDGCRLYGANYWN